MGKHIKLFEELKPYTYRSAGYKLARLGHNNRATELFYHSYDRVKQDLSEYGTFNIQLILPEYNHYKTKVKTPELKIEDEFYLSIEVMNDTPLEQLGEIQEGYSSNVCIPLSIGIVPKSRETLEKLSKHKGEAHPNMNYYIWPNEFTINIESKIIESEGKVEFKIKGFSYYKVDNETANFNRQSALKFKRLLIGIVSGEVDYPSHVKGMNMREELESIVKEMSVSKNIPVGITMDDILQNLNRLSVNTLYKQW